VVVGHSVRIDVRDGQGGGVAGQLWHSQRDAVPVEAGPQPGAEAVPGQAAQENRRQAQPPYRPGRVERPAADLRGDAAAWIDDKVDQRLTGDSDHASVSRPPRH